MWHGDPVGQPVRRKVNHLANSLRDVDKSGAVQNANIATIG